MSEAGLGRQVLDAMVAPTRSPQFLHALLLAAAIEAVRAGRAASTYVAPAELDSLTRRHLRESFRAIAHVQERLESQCQQRLG